MCWHAHSCASFSLFPRLRTVASNNCSPPSFRSRRMGSMNSEQENTLNQILTCMDGLDTSNNGVIVMGATNRFELLDPALLRSGRFDRIVQCPLPDRDGRNAILLVHTRKLKLAADVDLDRYSASSWIDAALNVSWWFSCLRRRHIYWYLLWLGSWLLFVAYFPYRIARLTPGTCGADLSAISNEGEKYVARKDPFPYLWRQSLSSLTKRCESICSYFIAAIAPPRRVFFRRNVAVAHLPPPPLSLDLH